MVIYLAGSSHPLLSTTRPLPSKELRRCNFSAYRIPAAHSILEDQWIHNIIGSLSVFEAILAHTDGGPGYDTESLSIYNLPMCYANKTGYSTAVALVLFMIILVPVFISLRFFQTVEDR